MKNYSQVTDPKDVATKEYADGKYSSSNPPPYPVTSVNGKTGTVTINVPTALSQLSGDTTHRVVTDAEKTTWNGKQSDVFLSVVNGQLCCVYEEV